MRKNFTTFVLGFIGSISLLYSQNQPVASFSAEESKKEIYKQGFDSSDGMTDWSIVSQNTANTWKVGQVKKSGLPAFSTIDPASQNSMVVYYDPSVQQNEQLISPQFTLTKPSVCSFYAAFDGVFAYQARMTLEVQNQNTSETTKIFDSFLWSQETGHERHEWLPFEFDLSEYQNIPIRLIFRYKGVDGDDAYIDNFRILENDISDDSKVSVLRGNEVHFKDLSQNNPTSWQWTFEGGEPATSAEQNPVVKYNNEGVYDVTLVVTNADGTDQKVRTDYVTVTEITPKASFDYPAVGYLSPEAAVYLPLNTDVTFTDKSDNMPDEWLWTLPGTNVGTSTDQNPTVQYTTEGTFDVKLEVKNGKGSAEDQHYGSVRAGIPTHIWNIYQDEYDLMGTIAVGWYGYYGGTNWLGMEAFAERFEKPIVKGSISSVDVYFAETETVISPVDIKLSIMNDKDGLPDQEIASKSLSTTALNQNPTEWVATTFEFDQPINVDDVFYIVVSGFPNRTDESTYETDNVVIGAVRRNTDSKRPTSTYHLLAEEDENFEPTGEYKWYKNEDENVSLMITPYFTYEKDPNSIEGLDAEDAFKPLVSVVGGRLKVNGLDGSFSVDIYDLTGRIVKSYRNAQDAVGMPAAKGSYVVLLSQGNKKWSYKILY